jgi:S1-C subfamily serine protease
MFLASKQISASSGYASGLGALRPVLMILMVACWTVLPSLLTAQETPATKTNKIVTAFGIQWSDTPEGLLIEDIDPQSPAINLGLKKGDLLVSVNGQAVTSGDSLAAELKKVAPGDSLRVEFARGQEAFVKSIAMPDSRVNMFGAFLQPGADNRIQVGEVSANTPADKAGLLKGDIIVSMAGQQPGTLAELSAVIKKIVESDKSAEPIEVTVRRPREPRPLTLVIERVPAPKPAPATAAPLTPAPRTAVAVETSAVVLGVSVVVQGNRVMVASVMERGPAATAGIQPGDQILSVAKRPIASFETLSAAVAMFRPGDTVAVEVQRGGKAGLLQVKAVKAPPDVVDVALEGQAAAAPAVAGQVQAGVQVNVPGGEGSDLASLTAEVRQLRARVEALEQLVKQMAGQQPEAQKNRRPLP